MSIKLKSEGIDYVRIEVGLKIEVPAK